MVSDLLGIEAVRSKKMATPADPDFKRFKDTLSHLQGKIRVRVGGLLFDDDIDPRALVLVEHSGIWSDASFWTPPGGAVEFSESLQEALVREVKEETGLSVLVGPLRYVLDFVRLPVHAVSFYFECTTDQPVQNLRTGDDPELTGAQLIRNVRLISFDELAVLNIYPEGLAGWLPEDAKNGFSKGLRYLGTLR